MAIPAGPVIVSMGVLFFLSGLVVNLIQAICFVLVRPLSKNTYRKINRVVAELLWLELVWIVDWWAGVKIRLFTDSETFRLMGKEHALVVCNHKSDIDWLVGWVLAQRAGCLGSALAVMKKSSKFLPVIGWSMWFSEYLFLERSWAKDERTLKSGTRFTQAKLEAAQEYAASAGLPVPRNVLIPRTKGFVSAVSEMRSFVPAIYEVTVAIPKSSPPPTMLRLFKGKSSVELQFECVPTSLMEQVTAFLNDVREDLRCSMAKDAETIKIESLSINKDPKCVELSINADKDKLQAQLPKDIPLDFQKKVIIAKHEKQEANSDIFLGKNETYKRLMEMEKEDQLFDELLHSRSVAMEKIRGNRQQFILVASLLDRIPNLAGLARTCEVFKAAGLAVADANIVNDKQFQLISVTADKWVPIVEVPVSNLKVFLQKKKREGFSILGLEQTANSIPLDQYIFPKKTVLVLGREKEGIPVEIIHILDACIEIPQLGVVRSLNVHVSGAIALWEYTRQQRSV